MAHRISPQFPPLTGKEITALPLKRIGDLKANSCGCNSALYKRLGISHPLSWENFIPLRNILTRSDVSVQVPANLNQGVRTLVQIAATIEQNAIGNRCIVVAVTQENVFTAAIGRTPTEAFERMISVNKSKLAGCFLVTNFDVDQNLARMLVTSKFPVRIAALAAPSISLDADSILGGKDYKFLGFQNPALSTAGTESLSSVNSYSDLSEIGVVCIQEPDRRVLDLSAENMQVEAGIRDRPLHINELRDLALAQAVCQSSKYAVIVAQGGKILVNVAHCSNLRDGCLEAVRSLSLFKSHYGAVVAVYMPFGIDDGLHHLNQAGIYNVLVVSGHQVDGLVKDLVHKARMRLFWFRDVPDPGF